MQFNNTGKKFEEDSLRKLALEYMPTELIRNAKRL